MSAVQINVNLQCAELGRKCRIVVTQPRRLAAITIATRVAEERGECVGEGVVGYKIRGASMVNQKRCRILFWPHLISPRWRQVLVSTARPNSLTKPVRRGELVGASPRTGSSSGCLSPQPRTYLTRCSCKQPKGCFVSCLRPHRAASLCMTPVEWRAHRSRFSFRRM